MSEKEKVDKAIKLYNDGKYQEAIDAFSSVLEVCQDNAELYNNIALCYANLGEYEKAEKYYLKAQDREIVSATTTYGIELDVAIHKDNVHAVQFHPEKSGVRGIEMLENFASLIK